MYVKTSGRYLTHKLLFRLIDGRHGETTMAQIVRNSHFLARVHVVLLEVPFELVLMHVAEMVGISIHHARQWWREGLHRMKGGRRVSRRRRRRRPG